jgi:CRISPR-associated endonuclease/helicase Cas3
MDEVAETGFVAHTPNSAGRWHPLSEHLRAVAELARGFGEKLGLADLAYWTGLLHDLGKYSPEFQAYLRQCHDAAHGLRPPPQPGSAPHKQAGASVAGQKAAPVLAFSILGHHGGMASRADTARALRESPLASIDPVLQRATADCSALSGVPDLTDQTPDDAVSARVARRLSDRPGAAPERGV